MANSLLPDPHTFLIRIWPVWSAGRLVWRASLIRLPQNERHGFRSFDDLIQFLTDQVSSGTRRAGDEEQTAQSSLSVDPTEMEKDASKRRD